jgi:hypothetical protein
MYACRLLHYICKQTFEHALYLASGGAAGETSDRRQGQGKGNAVEAVPKHLQEHTSVPIRISDVLTPAFDSCLLAA